VLQFSALENGISLIVLLIGCTPGAFASKYVTEKLDPVKSSMFALLVLITATALFAILIVRPKQYVQTYLIVFFWGMGIGWKWTIDRTLAALIIPEGQDTELMGFFLFSGQCLSWIPPLVYTAINEAGISQRVGLASLDACFILSFICYFLMGGYKEARIEVGRDANPEMEMKDMPGAEAPPDCDEIPNANNEE
jgi:MFS-type transporter involved in bile tolerance (Atg22 family)